jgi:hypothetical protein
MGAFSFQRSAFAAGNQHAFQLEVPIPEAESALACYTQLRTIDCIAGDGQK